MQAFSVHLGLLCLLLLLLLLLFTYDKRFFGVFDDFADRHATEPNINLVNKESLDNIFQARVFMHDEGQLRVAYLILGYKPISSDFQTSKCVIRARDPCLHRISVASLKVYPFQKVPS